MDECFLKLNKINMRGLKNTAGVWGDVEGQYRNQTLEETNFFSTAIS